MRAYERLLKYVTVRTPSDETSTTVPSSACQFDLAQDLIREFINLGLPKARTDEKCYVYAQIPATPGYENCPKIGFIAHLDTVSDFCDKKIVPVVTENYDGRDLPLGGSDDKAGVAEIMTMAERVLTENIPHGQISIGFTPDEEVGRGADHFDVEKFDADFAYTMDGDTEGEIQYENFNAADAIFEIKGVNVHPGSAKDVMVNAALVAMEINAALPEGETPADTEDYEGFYHLVSMSGDVACTKLHYIVRDHDTDKFAARLETLKEISKQMNLKWGLGTVKLTIDEQYRNMAEIIKDGNMHLIENAKKACLAADVTPLILPIRGGTDGARLSFMGLPCPNLGTGGHGYHGPFEHITAEGMDKSVEVMIELVKLYAEMK